MTSSWIRLVRMMGASFPMNRFILFSFFLSIPVSGIFAQGRLILNGAKINITQGATVVVDNPSPDAVTRISGHIISEGENNMLKWNMGTTTGTYIIPMGYGDSNYLPLSFTKTAGSGMGYFLFSTYHTGWQNSVQLPAGVINFNNTSGADKSAFSSDRFWKISGQNYTVKPSLSDLNFSYLDTEFSSPNNSTTESSLTAQRWNDNTNTWSDYAPPGNVDISANTVTLSSVNASDLYSWWVVTYVTDRHWVASTPSNWNDPMNWSTTEGGAGGAGVPTSFDNVFFDDVKDASFTLDKDATVESLLLDAGYTGTITQGANTITINNEAILSGGTFLGGSSDIHVAGDFTLAGTSFTSTSATLDLKGDFTFTSGTFAHNNGTVEFSGTSGSTQNIGGSVISNFNNITVTNTAAIPGARIQSNQNLHGVLTLGGNVEFDADGSSNTAILKLISTGDNPTQDAAIAVLPSGAQVTGNVTVQRFMTKEGPNNTRIYRYISSPVQNAPVADIQSEIPVTGSFTGTSVCSGCGTAQSMFAYNENVITDSNGSGASDFNDGYADFPNTSNTETFVPGRGYAMFVRGNVLSSTLWDVRGPINSGNITPISLPVTFTSSGNTANDGWNLVGNPFPSTIDWNAPTGWTKTNLNAAIYITDNGNSATQYATWNGVTGTNGGSRYIATGQGFWVKANGAGAPVLEANENVKAPGIQTSFFRESAPENLLRISMIKGITRDEAVVHFREDATEGFDPHADAMKLPNSTFNISTLANGKSLAINSMPSFDCQSEIKLTIEKPVAGNYSLDFSEYESFSTSISITLTDNFTNTNFDIRNGSYDFSVTANPASYGTDRFRINFVSQPLQSDFVVSTTDVCEGSDAVLQITNAQEGAEYTALFNGSPVSLPVIGNGGTIIITIPGESLLAGQDTIAVEATMPGCSLTARKNIAINVAKKINITSVEPGKNCREGAVTLTTSGAPENGYYNWYESESSALPLVDQHGASFTTPLLPKSKTYYVAAVNALGCEGLRAPILAEIVQFDDVQILESGDSLLSSYIDGNQWYFNQEPIFQATKQSLKPSQSGTYRVEVTIGGCITSTDYEFVTTGLEEPSNKIISVFPNPVINDLNITIADSFKNIEGVKIINSVGRVIGFIELGQLSEMKSGQFDMTNYPAGIYILQVIEATGVVEVKVVKQ